MKAHANLFASNAGVLQTERPMAEAADATRERYREGMARLGAAVNLVTTEGPGGRAGFTASAVCSVSDQPPTLLVCLNRSASVYATFMRNRVLCVNTLSHDQETLSQRFGGKTPMDNCRRYEPLLADAARRKADLVVLGEVLATASLGLDRGEGAEPIPGPSTEHFGRLAKAHEQARKRHGM